MKPPIRIILFATLCMLAVSCARTDDYRYQIITYDVLVIKLDRKTGQTWLLDYNDHRTWKPMIDQKPN